MIRDLRRFAFAALVLICAFSLGFLFLGGPLPANAANCGGVNQKACPALKKGPQCNQWLAKVKKICRPCGGLHQKACPVLKKGKPCKPGLKWKLGKCVKKVAKGNFKTRILQNARRTSTRLKPLIRKIGQVIKTLNKNKTFADIRSAFKTGRPDKAARIVQRLKKQIGKRALLKAGFRTLTLGISSNAGVGVAFARETGVAADVNERLPAKLFVSKTWSGGVQAMVGNDVVISAYSDNNNRINGKSWAAIGSFDVGSGLGLVIYYDKKTFEPKGLTVAIGAGSVGGGGAVGRADTALCPSRACNKVF